MLQSRRQERFCNWVVVISTAANAAFFCFFLLSSSSFRNAKDNNVYRERRALVADVCERHAGEIADANAMFASTRSADILVDRSRRFYFCKVTIILYKMRAKV